MVIEWTDFWNWRKTLTTDAAKRPLPRANRPWPEIIFLGPNAARHVVVVKQQVTQ